MRTVFILMSLFKNKQIPIPRTYKQVYLSFSLSAPPKLSLALSLQKGFQHARRQSCRQCLPCCKLWRWRWLCMQPCLLLGLCVVVGWANPQLLCRTVTRVSGRPRFGDYPCLTNVKISIHISDGRISRRSATCITVQTICCRNLHSTRPSAASSSGSDQWNHS